MCRKCRDIFNTAQVIGGGNFRIFIFINAITKQNGADNIFWGNETSPPYPLPSRGGLAYKLQFYPHEST